MSDFHEIALRRYEEEQDQLYREALEREQNPEYYWHIVTEKDWEDYAYSEEEKDQIDTTINDLKEYKKPNSKFEYTMLKGTESVTQTNYEEYVEKPNNSNKERTSD